MKTSNAGLSILKGLEGLRLNAYRDPAGVWTIGYGSTRYHDGKAVKPGDKLASEAQASALLTNTLGEYENAVNRSVKVSLTQNEFDALVLITYNVGTGITQDSTLFRKLNTGDKQGAADQFLVWDKITDPETKKHIVSPTLVKRRRQERLLFLTNSN